MPSVAVAVVTAVPAVNRSQRRLVLLLAAVALAASAMLGALVGPAVAADGPVVLAVAGDLGPEPMPRDAEDNPARELGGYEDLEIPFTWGAAWLLTFLGLGGLATMGLVYWRAVDRPGRGKAPVRR